MQCLKCGEETADAQVFCEKCLAVMQKYPVKPGTAIQLPTRHLHNTEKRQSPRYIEPSPAEQILHLRKTLRWLLSMIAVLSVLLILTAGLLLHTLDKETPISIIGQNYTSSTTGKLP